MSQGRFNNLFLLFLCLSGISAFVLPVEYTTTLRGIFVGVLEPIAFPVRRLAETATAQFQSSKTLRPNSASSPTPVEAQREIEQLRATVASLTLQLDDMRKLLGDRQTYGAAWQYSRVFKVLGGESSWRKSLTVRGDSRGLTAGMPVICRQGLIGRISSIGPMSAQTRLITEKGFCVIAAFSSSSQPGRIIKVQPPPLVEGRGDGSMAITNLTMELVKSAQLVPNDLVIVSDADFPSVVLGQTLGKIERIGKLGKEPLYAELIIRPIVRIDQLTEVMVVGDQNSRPLADVK